MADAPATMRFRALAEDRPGERLGEIYRRHRDAYLRWIERADPLPAHRAADALREHMPELVPTFEAMLEAFGGDEQTARFLSLYAPPRLVRACSQLIVGTPHGPALVRTYDHNPDLFDALIVRSRWGDRTVLAATDCLWGALDGVNDRGLAVALAFSGRPAHGPGFAAPLIVRYLLETCETTAEADEALGRLPVAMPYTFVVLDASGAHSTTYLSPDRAPVRDHERASTNHRDAGDWPAYAKKTRSVERLRCLHELEDRGASFEAAMARFLDPPLWRAFDRAERTCTLYCAAYRPGDASLTMAWPGHEERFASDAFAEREFEVELV